ncbi:MAG: AtpZ/AtpI family protein [Pseudomonadota bacterium]
MKLFWEFSWTFKDHFSMYNDNKIKNQWLYKLGKVSVISSELVIPIVGSLLLGLYLDKKFLLEPILTLCFFVIGIFITIARMKKYFKKKW